MGSIQDDYYTSGTFLEESHGSADAEFKVAELVRAMGLVPDLVSRDIVRIADVGCGSGEASLLLAEAFPKAQVHGYDIHPHTESLKSQPRVTFFRSDFCSATLDQPYDLVVLFDVIEHIPDPIHFIRQVAKRSLRIAFHIPLDDSWLTGIRENARGNLKRPGHLVVLNPATALTLVSLAGLRARTFTYTPVFRAPSGQRTRAQAMMNPLRGVLYRLSPWLAQRLTAGVSMMVIADSYTPLPSEGNDD